MKSFRLSPLMIFLIILGTLLIGYVLNHIWKNLESTVIEGFGTEDGIPLDGYSTTNLKVVPIVSDLLYFDPVNRALLNKPPGYVLFIKTKCGTDMSFNFGFDGTYKVVDIGFGDISYNNGTSSPIATIVPNLSSGTSTISDAKNFFKSLAGDSVIYMDVDLGNGGLNTVTNKTRIISARIYSDPRKKVAVTNAGYPILKTPCSTDYRKRRYYRVTKSFNVANLVAGNPVKYTYTTALDKRYAVVHIPVPNTSVSFLHVIDLIYKQHAETFYFNSATSDVASIRHGKDIFDKTVKNVPASLAEVNGTSVTPVSMSTPNDGDFNVALKYDETSKTLHVMGSKKDTVGRVKFYAILSFKNKSKLSINFSDTKIGNTTPSFVNDVKKDTPKKIPNNGDDTLLKTLVRMKLLKDFFTSPDNDYLLKTEVVPPVCPSCPSCPSCPGGGACSSCGGHGGSGTNTNGSTQKLTSKKLAKDFGSGATNLLRDGAKGTTNLIRDGAGGVTSIAKDSVNGVGNFAKESASGIGNFAKDSASGIGNFAKDIAGGAALGTAAAVGGVYGMGRDAVGGAYNAATGTVSGTVGLGREIITGTAGMLNNGQGSQGSQGGYYGNGGPNMSMGGYQNSYGGQSSYQQPLSAIGQDPYSYFGAVPSRTGSGSNYMPRTADFSHFGK